MQSAAARHNRRKQAEGMTIPLGVRDPARRVTDAKTDHHCQRRFEESTGCGWCSWMDGRVTAHAVCAPA